MFHSRVPKILALTVNSSNWKTYRTEMDVINQLRQKFKYQRSNLKFQIKIKISINRCLNRNTLIGETIANLRCFCEFNNHGRSKVTIFSIRNFHIHVPTFWVGLSCLENHFPDALSNTFTFRTSLFHRNH